MDDKENLQQFLTAVEEAARQFEALMLLSKLIELLMQQSDPDNMSPEVLDRVLNEIIGYGDTRVMREMTK